MLSALFRSNKNSRLQIDHSPYSSNCVSPVVERRRYFSRRVSQSSAVETDNFAVEDDEAENENEDGDDVLTPLLPIFSVAHLDSLPVYSQTHALRAEIISRCDTILTWEQLRTPQVSSFLVKPILANLLRSSEKLSRGTIYCLMANCLQFRKEAHENPGNAGVSMTRALLSELLAVKLLKEFSYRELIDALCYDFYPLQGMSSPTASSSARHATAGATTRPQQRASRISALEVAIRAQAKKFLSHPLVIRQLDAIWAGTVVFHSGYDQMHRPGAPQPSVDGFRKTATLYDTRDASLFKLSRLRVPRYRHITSTVSLGILMLLHLMVLYHRSYRISTLEVIFWIWSLGFMMDEIAGFNETGVSLYFMSLWNTFDMGIFILFTTFYALRILGLVLPGDRTNITAWSFDVLGSCAVFLYPRIFAVLDHFRYFSQLIIAFRIMAVDMVALLILIGISCSGFFVAFTFSFARDRYSANDVLYHLFQILLGFTPAAWDAWPYYNLLGKFLLTAFLIICHFLIVTILITVLTNSFAAVAANAQEEHQFLVAVNTISLVKNDSLFSYVAPTNLFAWILHPCRWFMPFRKFVKLNRIVIKVTHFPILFLICVYEKTVLRDSVLITLPVDDRYNAGTTAADVSKMSSADLLNPVVSRLRGESIGSRQQAMALDEVFRRPFRSATLKTDTGGPGVTVDSWMNGVIAASPPTEAEPGINSRRSNLRFSYRLPRESYGSIQRTRRATSVGGRGISASRSVLSDPEDFTTSGGAYGNLFSETENIETRTEDDDADNEANSGDDENNDDDDLLVDDGEEAAETLEETPTRYQDITSSETDAPLPSGFSTPCRPKQDSSTAAQSARRTRERPSRHHSRKNSNTTVLFDPQPVNDSSDSDTDHLQLPRQTGQRTPGGRSSGHKTPRSRPQTARPRPVTAPRQAFQSVPNLSDIELTQKLRRRGSSIITDIAADDTLGAVPSSFATQMAMATGKNSAADLMLSRLVLARIGALEESFKDVREILKEVKKMRKDTEEEKRGRKRANDKD